MAILRLLRSTLEAWQAALQPAFPLRGSLGRVVGGGMREGREGGKKREEGQSGKSERVERERVLQSLEHLGAIEEGG